MRLIWIQRNSKFVESMSIQIPFWRGKGISFSTTLRSYEDGRTPVLWGHVFLWGVFLKERLDSRGVLRRWSPVQASNGTIIWSWTMLSHKEAR